MPQNSEITPLKTALRPETIQAQQRTASVPLMSRLWAAMEGGHRQALKNNSDRTKTVATAHLQTSKGDLEAIISTLATALDGIDKDPLLSHQGKLERSKTPKAAAMVALNRWRREGDKTSMIADFQGRISKRLQKERDSWKERFGGDVGVQLQGQELRQVYRHLQAEHFDRVNAIGASTAEKVAKSPVDVAIEQALADYQEDPGGAMLTLQSLLGCHPALSPVPAGKRRELQAQVDEQLAKVIASAEVETLGDLQAQQRVVESLAASIQTIIDEA